MRCLVLGSTGATGQSLVNLLTTDGCVTEVLLINRKKVVGNYPSKVKEKVIDDLMMLEEAHVGDQIDVAFCCIGTTSAKASRVSTLKINIPYLNNHNVKFHILV
jgi:aspartate-semialdehyde dehydrogenase